MKDSPMREKKNLKERKIKKKTLLLETIIYMNMKEHINDLFFFLLIIWVLFLTSCEKQDPLCKKGE